MNNPDLQEISKYRLDIQGMRAIAVLLVFAGHVGLDAFEGGFIGVDVFFVISGYVITQLILLEYQNTQQFNFIRFYVNRLKRLLPALILVIATVAVALYWLLSPTVFAEQLNGAISASAWVSNLFFLFQNQDYFSKQDALENFFLHTWSLGIEEQFYLIWPLLIVFILSARLFKARLIYAIMTLAVLSLALHLAISATSDLVSFYLMPTRFWQFALGGVAAYLKINQKVGFTAQRGNNEMAYLLGIILIFLASLTFDSNIRYPYWYVLIPTIGTFFIMLADPTTQTISGRILSSKFMVWIGDLSYSFYLWHWPVILFIDQYQIQNEWSFIGLAFGLTLILSIISFYILENPLRKFKSLRPYKEQIVLLIAVMVIFCSFLISFGKMTENHEQHDSDIYKLASTDIPPIYSLGCDTWYQSDELTPCFFGNKSAGKTAVLFGDSILAQWFTLVAMKYTQHDWNLVVLTKSACPIVNETFYYERIKSEYLVCDNWRAKALAFINQIQPQVLITGSASTYPFDKHQWKSGTRQIIERLGDFEVNIKIIAGTPQLAFNGPQCLSQFEKTNKNCESPLVAAESWQWLDEVANEFNNVTFLQLNQYICPDQTCRAMISDQIVFRDEQHLTNSFVNSLYSLLAEKF